MLLYSNNLRTYVIVLLPYHGTGGDHTAYPVILAAVVI
jgi:hypothetical protein